MVAIALWHLELTPGQPQTIYVRRDFQITNASLGEELVDANSRSVIKVQHTPIHPRYLESDDEESDSDFEDFEDDEELDEDEEEEEVKGKKGKGEEEEDDDEDDDEDMESDFSIDEPSVSAVIASLTPGKIEQATLNLIFTAEEAIIFEVTGKNTVHLMGNYIKQELHDHSGHGHEQDDYDGLYSSDEDEDDDMESITSSQAEDMRRMFMAEQEEEDAGKGGKKGGKKGRFEEIEESEIPAPKSNKRKAATQEVDSPISSKIASAITSTATAAGDAISSAAAALTSTAKEAKKEGVNEAGEMTKTAKKKLAKKMKLESGEGVAAAVGEKAGKVAEKAKEAAAPVKKEAKSNKRTLPSGLIIEDTKLGDGPVAKSGKKLAMRYIGKLQNGKQFDANTGGAPFTFNLGRGEVIKGWDQGLAGMAVGGERRLTIPASLAYGSQKIPGIPPNSTLLFEVKLVNVK